MPALIDCGSIKNIVHLIALCVCQLTIDFQLRQDISNMTEGGKFAYKR